MAREPFSKRTAWDRQSNALNAILEELKAQPVDIVDLTESNPTRCGFDYPQAITQVLSDPRNLDYVPDSRGMMQARKAVGEFTAFDPSRIILTASTSESYSFLFRLLLDPGDKVLVPKPSYPLFQFLLELNDAEYEHYPLVYEGGSWHIDFKTMEYLVDARTKAIVLVNPNNPTGSYLKADELKLLNAFCRKHGLAIISDEVFMDYRLEKGPFVSLKDNQDVLTFVMGGLSKAMALPQMKLGWILASGPKDVTHEALERLEIIADTFLSVNTPVQNALSSWFACAGDLQGQIMDRVRANLKILTDAGVKVLPVEGGWYAILDMGDMDEEAFVLEALHKHHILVHPGFFFDIQAPGHLVVSLLPRTEQFVKILTVIGDTHRNPNS